MPIYEFRCEACGQVFEHLAMKSGDNLEIKCPECGGEELSRVISSCSSTVSGSTSADSGGPSMESHNCGSGNCASITLPGHTR